MVGRVEMEYKNPRVLRISQVVEKLGKLKERHGDLGVMIEAGDILYCTGVEIDRFTDDEDWVALINFGLEDEDATKSYGIASDIRSVLAREAEEAEAIADADEQ